jgi:hypothetical protein
MREESEGSSNKKNKCIGRTRASSSARPAMSRVHSADDHVRGDRRGAQAYLPVYCMCNHPSINHRERNRNEISHHNDTAAVRWVYRQVRFLSSCRNRGVKTRWCHSAIAATYPPS